MLLLHVLFDWFSFFIFVLLFWGLPCFYILYFMLALVLLLSVALHFIFVVFPGLFLSKLCWLWFLLVQFVMCFLRFVDVFFQPFISLVIAHSFLLVFLVAMDLVVWFVIFHFAAFIRSGGFVRVIQELCWWTVL